MRRSNGHHDISADSPTSANPVSSKENMFYNASASSLNKLQNKLNISLHSLELLQEELHREDKVTLFEAKRTWLFARRLADLYGGGHFLKGVEIKRINTTRFWIRLTESFKMTKIRLSQ